MATIPVRQAAQDYESQKLQEAFRLHEVPLTANDATVDPSVMSAPERARTRRFRRELEAIDRNAIALLLAGLTFIVSVAFLYL